jgi:hypothetical protein
MCTQGHNISIAQTMEFSAEDLAQNRRGQVSPMQRQKLDVLRDMFVSDLHDTSPLYVPSVIHLMVIAVLAGFLHPLAVLDLECSNIHPREDSSPTQPHDSSNE